MKYSVVVSFSMEGFHCWPEAKDIFPEVAFLSDQHRHQFGFRCYAKKNKKTIKNKFWW